MNQSVWKYYWESPLGVLEIKCTKEALSAVRICRGELADYPEMLSSMPKIVGQCIQELDAYFKGELTRFTVKLAPEGTDFQKRVWEALRQIPYGGTSTYAELGKKIGNPRACRAVGNANHCNPLQIIVPCHRVIGANGSLTGYAAGLSVKEWLLNHEKKNR